MVLRKSLEEAEAELRRMKKLPKKPAIKPSNLDKPKEEKGSEHPLKIPPLTTQKEASFEQIDDALSYDIFLSEK